MYFLLLRSFVEVLQFDFTLGIRNDGQMQYKNTECYATEKNLLLSVTGKRTREREPTFSYISVAAVSPFFEKLLRNSSCVSTFSHMVQLLCNQRNNLRVDLLSTVFSFV